MDFNEEMKKWQEQKKEEFNRLLFTGWIISGLIGAFLWPYIINAWLKYVDKPPSVQWWQGVLIGMVPFVGPLSIPTAVVTWILIMILK